MIKKQEKNKKSIKQNHQKKLSNNPYKIILIKKYKNSFTNYYFYHY